MCKSDWWSLKLVLASQKLQAEIVRCLLSFVFLLSLFVSFFARCFWCKEKFIAQEKDTFEKTLSTTRRFELTPHHTPFVADQSWCDGQLDKHVSFYNIRLSLYQIHEQSAYLLLIFNFESLWRNKTCIQEGDFHSKACSATVTEHPEPIKPEKFLINQRDLMNAMGIRRNKTKEDNYKCAQWRERTDLQPRYILINTCQT